MRPLFTTTNLFPIIKLVNSARRNRNGNTVRATSDALSLWPISLQRCTTLISSRKVALLL